MVRSASHPSVRDRYPEPGRFGSGPTGGDMCDGEVGGRIVGAVLDRFTLIDLLRAPQLAAA